jgi:hypothetical protein
VILLPWRPLCVGLCIAALLIPAACGKPQGVTGGAHTDLNDLFIPFVIGVRSVSEQSVYVLPDGTEYVGIAPELIAHVVKASSLVPDYRLSVSQYDNLELSSVIVVLIPDATGYEDRIRAEAKVLSNCVRSSGGSLVSVVIVKTHRLDEDTH